MSIDKGTLSSARTCARIVADEVRAVRDPVRPAGLLCNFPHGLTGYNDGGGRAVGAHPGREVTVQSWLQWRGVSAVAMWADWPARLLVGERLASSIFDTR
jgi:hypothetical protein